MATTRTCLYFPKDGSSLKKAISVPQSADQLEDEFALIGKYYHGPMFPVEQTLVCEDGRLCTSDGHLVARLADKMCISISEGIRIFVDRGQRARWASVKARL